MSTTATLDGSFNIGAHKWYWDANANIGFNDAKQSFTGNVRADRVAQALGPLALCTAPCVPLNIFGGNGSITADQLAFISFTERDRSSQHLADFTANLSGDLFDLPAGAVGLAVGYEHRIQSGSFNPDPIIAAGLGADIPSQPAQGRYNSDEVYAELRVPILKGHAVLLFARSDRLGPSTPITQSPAPARPTPVPAYGSRSKTCYCAAAMRPVSVLQVSANCLAAGRASTWLRAIRAATIQMRRRPQPINRVRRSGQTAPRMGFPPTAATRSRKAASYRSSRRAMQI